MTDMELILQPTKEAYLKLSLVDNRYQEIDQLEGELIDLSLTISAESDIRRVASANLHFDLLGAGTGDFITNYFGRWMQQMVWLYYGIYDKQLTQIRWFLLGSFLFTSSSYTYDASNRQLSLSLADMMSAMTEERGSQIGYSLMFPADSNIADALESTIARFSNYKATDICQFEDTVPYDITIGMGGYPLTALKKLVELYPWYEQFYTTEGVYTARRIPTAMEDSVTIGADDLCKAVISETGSVDYREVKNCTEIWGRNIDANYTATDCISTGIMYGLIMGSEFSAYEDGMLVCFTADEDNKEGQHLSIENMSSYPIMVESGIGQRRVITAGEMKAMTTYVVRYTDNQFILQGEAQIHVMCMEYNVRPSDTEITGLKAFHNCNDLQIVVNPDSPFACDRIGIIKQVLYDGDYASIYTTQLAHERASYENWKTTRLQDSITLETLFIPWLDVNQKVAYKSVVTGETWQYIIRSIEVSPMSGIMNIKMVRFYPLYPWLEG